MDGQKLLYYVEYSSHIEYIITIESNSLLITIQDISLTI